MNPSYDPISEGARCSECPLQPYRNGPCGSTLIPDAKLTVVTEAPVKEDVESGVPLFARSGRLFNSVLAEVGVTRSSVSVVHVMECRVPGESDDLKQYLRTLKKEHPESITPMEACRPRLLKQLEQANSLLLFGNTALKEVAGIEGIKAHAGHPVRVKLPLSQREVWATPALHPAAVLRDLRQKELFRKHVHRAIRIAHTNRIEWSDGQAIIGATTDQLINWMKSRGSIIATDVETSGLDFNNCNVRCVGFAERVDGGERDESLVYGITSVKGHAVHPVADIQRGIACLREEMPKRVNIAFNKKVECTVYERLGVEVPLPQWQDAMEAHHNAWSELRHDLSTVAGQYLDVEYWKDIDWVEGVKSDQELWVRNFKDSLTTARLTPYVLHDVMRFGVQKSYQVDLKLSDICRKMTRLGIYVNREAQQQLASRLYKEFHEALGSLRAVAGEDDFNPYSTKQVCRWLYEKRGYTPCELTKAGEPSTSKTALLRLVEAGVDHETSMFIDGLFETRDVGKLLSVYVGVTVPHKREWETYEESENDDDYDADDSSLIIGADGRVHPTWSCHVTPSGRMACSRPGIQQQPKSVRRMFQAQPGHVLVGADGEQAELRVMAIVANVARFKKVFAEGGDIHSVSTKEMLGITKDAVLKQYHEAFDGRTIDPANVPKELRECWHEVEAGTLTLHDAVHNSGAEHFKRMRNLGKSVAHALDYTATPKKVFEMVRFSRRVAPDIRAGLTRRFTDLACKRWAQTYPEIPVFQQAAYDFWKAHGYVATPWHGRKRFFANGDKDKGAMGNLIVQGGWGDIFNEATAEVESQIPFDFERHTGIVIQNHDQLVVEVDERDGERAAKIIEQAMYREIDGVKLFAKAEIGKSWDLV